MGVSERGGRVAKSPHPYAHPWGGQGEQAGLNGGGPPFLAQGVPSHQTSPEGPPVAFRHLTFCQAEATESLGWVVATPAIGWLEGSS